MDNFQCEICNKIFKTSYILDTHKKTTKRCLKKQGLIVNTFQCEYCDKILTTNSRLNTHIQICKIKLKKEKENEEKIKEQFTQYEDFKEQIKQKDDMILKIKEQQVKDVKDVNEIRIDLNLKLKERDRYISKLEELLEKANQTIADIAKQPNTTNTDFEEETPLTVREKNR